MKRISTCLHIGHFFPNHALKGGTDWLVLHTHTIVGDQLWSMGWGLSHSEDQILRPQSKLPRNRPQRTKLARCRREPSELDSLELKHCTVDHVLYFQKYIAGICSSISQISPDFLDKASGWILIFNYIVQYLSCLWLPLVPGLLITNNCIHRTREVFYRLFSMHLDYFLDLFVPWKSYSLL